MSTEVNLKWGKKSYMVAIPTGMSTGDFKAQVQSLVGRSTGFLVLHGLLLRI
jgi:hypothetical protein